MKKIIKKIPKKNKGFSLLELLLAVVLLAIVVTPLIQTIYTSMALNNKARIQMGATNVGQSVLEYFESMTYSDINKIFEDHLNATLENSKLGSIPYGGKVTKTSASYPDEGSTDTNKSKTGWTNATANWANNKVANNQEDCYIVYKDNSDCYYAINKVNHNGYNYDLVVFITPLFEGSTYTVYEVQIDVYYDDPKDATGVHNRYGHLMTTLKGSIYNKLED